MREPARARAGGPAGAPQPFPFAEKCVAVQIRFHSCWELHTNGSRFWGGWPVSERYNKVMPAKAGDAFRSAFTEYTIIRMIGEGGSVPTLCFEGIGPAQGHISEA